MSSSKMHRRLVGFLTGFTVVSSCLFVVGCAGPEATVKQGVAQWLLIDPPRYIRYPAVIYDVPRCYNRGQDGTCQKEGTYLYLDFEYLANSDSQLWQDITKRRKGNKMWRLSIYKAADGAYVDGKPWSPMSDVTVELTLPLETLLSSDFEFCSRDTSTACDEDTSSDKTVHRNLPFLMHIFPEQPMEKKAEK